MLRKWTILALTMTTFTAVSSSLSVAGDEDSPIHKLMETVSAKNNAISKGVRTAVAFKKSQKDVAANATELAKLGKEAREIKEPAEKQKKSFAEWTSLMDDYIKKAEGLAEVAGKSDAKQEEAKKAHNAVKASCTACHNVFRVEDE
ncbi:MAG: hypothetical protein NVSMB9_03080 [Isosphaeraceae bacterium]